MSNTTSAPEMSPTGTEAGYHGPTLMDLLMVEGNKITTKEKNRQSEGGNCMYCVDSRHFVVSCQRKLKVALGQVEINPINEDQGKGKEPEEESRKV
jgi:hypothetical protein